MKKIFVFFFIGISLSSFSQNLNIKWEKTIGGSKEETSYKGVRGLNHNFYFVGTTNSLDGDIINSKGDEDVIFVKLDSLGNKKNVKTFGGSFIDNAADIKATADSGFIIVGKTNSIDGDVVGKTHSALEMWIVKLDKNYNISWQKFFGGSANDNANSVTICKDGGYFVVGGTASTDGDVVNSNGSDEVFIVKIDSLGNKQWIEVFGGSGMDGGVNGIQTNDGGFLVSCFGESNDGDFVGNHSNLADVYLIKLDSTGKKIWIKPYGGSFNDYGSELLELPNGDIIVSGSSESSDGDVNSIPANGEDGWLLKINKDGIIIWSKTYGGDNQDVINDVSLSKEGNYLMCGYAFSSNLNAHSSLAWDGWVLIADSTDGHLISQKCFGGNDYESLYTIMPLNDGFIVSGYTNSSSGDVSVNHGGASDIWIARIGCSQPSKPDISKSGPVLTALPTGLKYQWYRNGKLLPADTNRIINTDKQNGNYKVRVQNECGYAFSDSLIYNGVNIYQMNETVIQISPNPFSSRAFVTYSIPHFINSAQLQVFDLQGRFMFSKGLDVKSSNTTIEGNMLSSGVYYYNLSIDGQETGKKKMVVVK